MITKKNLPLIENDLALYLIKTGSKRYEQIEFYRMRDSNPGKYGGEFHGNEIYFRNSVKPDTIKKYTGELLEWNEKRFRKFVKELNFEELSAALEDIASNLGSDVIGLPAQTNSIGNRVVIHQETSNSFYSFQEWGEQIVMSYNPQPPEDKNVFAPNSSNYVYLGNLSAERFMNIAKKLDFEEAKLLFQDWTRPPKSGECYMPEPNQEEFVLEYHKESSDGKRIDIFDQKGRINHLFFREYPEPNELKVCTGEIKSNLHPMYKKSLFKKLNLDELIDLLNDLQTIYESD